MTAVAGRAAAAVAAVRALPDAPPGVVVGVAVAGTTELAADGVRSPDGTPVTPGTRFDVASVTKVAATTAAVLALVRSGDLALDDQVDRYLASSPCPAGTTIRDLLTHRAGLWEWQPLYLTPDPHRTLDGLPLRYPPGTERHYSDLGFVLLGRVVAAVAGAPLDRAVRDLVHDPLGMTRTGYGPVEGDVASSAFGDRVEQRMIATGEPYPVVLDDPGGFAWRTDVVTGEVSDGNAHHAFGGVSGHAGLFSTATDLLALGRAHAAGADPELLQDGPDEGQAPGWRSMPVTLRGRCRRMLWHPGYTGCALGFVPAEDVAVVLLSNRLLTERPVGTAELWATALAALNL